MPVPPATPTATSGTNPTPTSGTTSDKTSGTTSARTEMPLPTQPFSRLAPNRIENEEEPLDNEEESSSMDRTNEVRYQEQWKNTPLANSIAIDAIE